MVSSHMSFRGRRYPIASGHRYFPGGGVPMASGLRYFPRGGGDAPGTANGSV